MRLLLRSLVPRVYQPCVGVTANLRRAACLDFIREGDTLVVAKLDRLARSTQHLLEIAGFQAGEIEALRTRAKQSEEELKQGQEREAQLQRALPGGGCRR